MKWVLFLMKCFESIKLILLLICLCAGVFQAVNAAGLKSLVPTNIDSSVTKAEIAAFDEYYPGFSIPENNDDKKMSWGLAQYIHSLLFMYEMTNDVQYLDYAIDCADRIIKAKKTNEIDYVTQEVIPGWGYLNTEFAIGSKPVLYNNVVGNATIIRALSRISFLIKKHGLDETYQSKAQTYIHSSIETINYFLGSKEWFSPQKNIFHFPQTKRHDRVLNGVRGLVLAHNRQLLMASGMLYVLQYYQESANAFPYEKEYGEVIDSVANYFWAKAKLKKKRNTVSYTWHYREKGKNGKKPKTEDISHGGYDVKALVHIYKERKIGSQEKMQGLASTLIDRALVDPKNHRFSYFIDGTKPKSKKNSKKTQRGSIRWLALSEWDRRIFDSAGKLLLNNLKLSGPLPYAEFLYFKSQFYGIEE